MPPEATTIAANRPPDGLLLSTISLPLLLSGADNMILYANEAAEAFFGRSSRRIIGEPAQSLLRFASERLNGEVAVRESDISAQNMRFLTHGAQANYVDLNITTPLGYPDCRLYILVPRQADRDQIGEQTDGGKQQAMGAPAILGHEIKNPLAGIKGAAQLLARKVDAQHLFAAARNLQLPARVSFNGNKALLILDRWAAAIAQNDGERRWRSEGLLLLRLGLIGR